MILLCYFINELMKHWQVAIQNETMINGSFVLLLASIVVLSHTEEFKEDETPCGYIRLPYLMIAQIMFTIAYGFGHLSTNRQIELILGNKDILMAWNPHSPIHNHFLSLAPASDIEQYKAKHYSRYLGYLGCVLYLETATQIGAILWAISMLQFSAGLDAGTKHKEWADWWRLDQASLLSTLSLTFALVLISLVV